MTRRKLLALGLALGLWLGCAEVLSFFVGRLLQSRWAMYTDPVAGAGRPGAQISYLEYLERRDPVLGWPFPSQIGSGDYEANGALTSPANDALDQPQPYVSLYGDSYVQARNVPAEDAWDVALARRLGRRVDNFGVGGYGSDQAYVRFLENRADEAPIAILGHMSEDVSRNLTRYRDFQNFAAWYAFKPRFVIGADGELERVPIPRLDPDEYERFLARAEPQLVLEHELFHPNGPSGAVRLEFPYSLSLWRNVGYWRFQVAWRSRRDGVREPDYAVFYDPGHPFRGTDITHRILAGFHAEANARGKHALVVLFPSPDTASYRRATGRWTYAPLLERLHSSGVDVLDFGPVLLRHLEGREVEEAYADYHFVAGIYSIVADEVLHALDERGWLEAAGGAPRGDGSTRDAG